MQRIPELIKNFLCIACATFILTCSSSRSTYATDWLISQKLPDGSWDNRDDARQLQKRLIALGCLTPSAENEEYITIENKKKTITLLRAPSENSNPVVNSIGTNTVGNAYEGADGLWGRTSVAAFYSFLDKSGKSYAAGMSTAEVLALFDGVTKSDLGGCPQAPGLKYYESSVAGSKCDLPRLVDSWLAKQDEIAKGKISDSDKDKKAKYIPFLTLKRALDSADNPLDGNNDTRNVDNVIPDKLSTDLEEWLLPKSIDLDVRRDELKKQISNLRFNITAIARYYAIQDEARYKSDMKSKTSSCQRCIFLIEYNKLEKAVKIFGENNTLVTRTGSNRINVNEITFAMLQNQLANIRSWDVSFKKWIGQNRSEDGKKAREQLDDIVNSMASHQEQFGRHKHNEELAVSWMKEFDRDCGEFAALGNDGGMPALVWN